MRSVLVYAWSYILLPSCSIHPSIHPQLTPFPLLPPLKAVTSSLTLMVQSMKPPGTGAEGSPDSAPPELMWVMMILDFVCFLAVNGIIGAPSKPEPKAKKAAPPVVDKPVVKAPNADAKPEGQPKK